MSSKDHIFEDFDFLAMSIGAINKQDTGTATVYALLAILKELKDINKQKNVEDEYFGPGD